MSTDSKRCFHLDARLEPGVYSAIINRNPLIITKCTKTPRTSTRQRIPRLLTNHTRQTLRERRTPSLRSHLSTIHNHPTSFRPRILYFRRTLPTRKRIIVIRQKHNRNLARIITAKKGRTDSISICRESRCWRNYRHFGQAGELGLHVSLVELAAVGKIGTCVCRVVVYEDYAYAARGLQEGEDGVVLKGFAAVDESEGFLAGYEGGVGVVVEGVGVDGIFVAGG